ncbi:hypothetical protein NFI96_010833, partial [Prochilodus magdalenae]
ITDTVNSGLQSASFIDNSEEYQLIEKSAIANKHEMDSDLVKMSTDMEQTWKITPEGAEHHNIQFKPQSGSTLKHEPETAGMERRLAEDTSSHGPQTSHTSRSIPNSPCRRYSLDETGDNVLCGDVQENRTKVLDPKSAGAHLEGASGVIGEKSCLDSETRLQATEETESLKPPAKKRLRRRMGMCGLGDRTRRFLLERHRYKEVLNRGESLEVVEAAGEEYKGILNNNAVVENDGAALMDDEGTTKQVLLEQMITGKDRDKVQDEPSVDKLSVGTTARVEPNLPGTESNHGQEMEITRNPKGLLEDEWIHSEGTPETTSPDGDEVCCGSSDVTNGGSEDPKGSPEWPVTEGVNLGIQGITSELCKGSKETSACLVEVAEDENYGTIGHTNKVFEGSKETVECSIAEEFRHGVISEAFEGAKETAKCPVADQVTNGGTDEVCEGSKEATQTPVSIYEAVICQSTGITDEDCDGSNETTKQPVTTEVSYGSVPIDKIHEDGEGCKEVIQDDEALNYGSTAVTDEGCGDSKETTECQVTLDVIFSPVGDTDKTDEGSEESTGAPVDRAEGECYGSFGITDGVCEVRKETTDFQVKAGVEVSYGSTSVTEEICEGFKAPTVTQVEVSREVSHDSIAVTNKVCEGPTECPVEVPEKVRHGSVGVNEVCEGSVRVSKEVQESITALEESEIEIEEQCPPEKAEHLVPHSLDLGATTEQEIDGLPLSMPTAIDKVSMEQATASTESAISIICDAEDQCDDVRFPQTLNKTEAGPDVEGGSTTEELEVPEAPPTGQEKQMHFLLGQDLPDPSVIPTVAEEPVFNPSLTAATEFPQDDNTVHLSQHSVTDSQLNDIALCMEVDDQLISEGFHHQEDATELVCGLIKELSSLKTPTGPPQSRCINNTTNISYINIMSYININTYISYINIYISCINISTNIDYININNISYINIYTNQNSNYMGYKSNINTDWIPINISRFWRPMSRNQ